MGFVLGEGIAFVILLFGMDGDRKIQDYIFKSVTGSVLVVGLFVSIFMVKDRKQEREILKVQRLQKLQRRASLKPETDAKNRLSVDEIQKLKIARIKS